MNCDRPRARATSNRVRSRPGPSSAQHAQRRAHAFDREQAEVLELEVSRRQRRGVLGEIGAPRLAELFHARCQADGMPLRGVVHAQVVADRADDHVARIESHAHRELQPAIAAQGLRVLAQRARQVQRGMTGALGVVLVRQRRAEQRHDAVARCTG